jgi:Fic family protein
MCVNQKKKRTPAIYRYDFLDSYEPNLSFYLSQDIRDELLDAGKRLVKKAPAGTLAKKIYNRLLIDLSYNSSRLEGNTYSLLETERLIFSNEEPYGKIDQEKVMILNHKEAIRYLVDHADSINLDLNHVLTLHYLLSDALIPADFSGKVRNEGVFIGSSTYTPLEDKNDLTLILNEILKKAEAINSSFEQSFFLLVHLSYLQAFLDVNKPTARLVSNIPLIQANLIPFSFNGIDKNDYALAMIAFYETLDFLPFAALYRQSYLTTCSLYDANVQGQEFNPFYARYRTQRRKILALIIQKCIASSEIASFVTEQAKQLVVVDDQEKFVKDVLKDITLLDYSRIAGLGIAPEAFDQWKKLQQN